MAFFLHFSSLCSLQLHIGEFHDKITNQREITNCLATNQVPEISVLGFADLPWRNGFLGKLDIDFSKLKALQICEKSSNMPKNWQKIEEIPCST